ncbi:uncharacterized protein YndB with AHSA1/START domain [Mucilaginibacter yixingensis]|uniref:Uncharacterized protein YndB with AHSA1/START domain n=1 Tax=Mucilaginibacter yixingensis TaxID=1295612 RepID=A0A2T5JE25_9SPHI|nr:SRPBCC family protein [Mucilaginibacter yixingensis]PTR00028.1 uncharacterized protein YndB with AHSA1/START domain [Mucilaginibacter yixingensis]
MELVLIIVYFILGLIGTIIIILLIAAAASSEDYTISREVVINRPRQEVFDYVRILKNQDYYSKWVMTDLNAQRTFTGTDGQPGFLYTWDSDNKQVGQGEQEIKSIKEGQQMITNVRFIKPFEGGLEATFTTRDAGQGQTNINWTIQGKRNLMMRMFHIMMSLPKKLGADMAESLNNLKRVLEK